MKTFNLNIEWKTNEFYDVETLALTLTDEKIAAIKKAQTILKENSDFDSIRVMIDEKNISTASKLHRLGYGFVLVRAGDTLYFVGTDHYDSSNQVESESFVLDDFSMAEIEDFVDEWGQTDDEICAALGYEEGDPGSIEMIMGDGYKWFERYQKWFPKSSSMYSEREQQIMDYLNLKYC